MPQEISTRYWRIMTVLDRSYGSFTGRIVADIAGDRSTASIDRYLDWLVQEQLVVPAEVPGPATGWRILNHGDAPPMRHCTPATAQAQQALWRALRTLKQASIWELACTAATETQPVSLSTAQAFVRELERAGYVHALPAATPRRGAYRLLPARDSGPRAPVVRRGVCFDLNLMRAVNVNRTAALARDGRAA